MWRRAISVVISLCVMLAPLSVTIDTTSLSNPLAITIEKAEAAPPLILGGLVLGSIAAWYGGGSWIKTGIETVVAYAGAMLITLAATFLALAGVLFDYTIWAFAANFTGTLEFWGVIEAIRRIWVVFRDLSQIVLIGFFIFIAINIILNNHEYSIKQHAVRAILVALFMNFSLFFSMAVIDVSNFVAYQFYRGIAGVGGSAITDAAGITSGQANISQRISTAFGITELNDFRKLVEKLKSEQPGSPGLLLVTSIGIAIIFLISAFVFFYCAWLLTVRAVMLILVMVTSSLATAALIIPSFSKYFNEWRTSLLSNAFFAPLLLLMLWTVIQIMDAIAKSPAPGLRVEGIFDPTITNAGGALGRYAVMVTLFVVAVQVADMLAKKGNQMFGTDVKSKLSGGFGMVTGAAFGSAAASVRKGRLALAERQLKNLEAAHDGHHDTPESKEKAREKLEKYKSRLNTSGDFRDAAVMKALQKLGIQTGKAGKEPLKKTIDTKRATEKAKGERMADFQKAQVAEKDKKEGTAFLEEHNAKEVKSTELKQAIDGLKETVQAKNTEVSEAKTLVTQATESHTAAAKALEEYKAQVANNPGTASDATKQALEKKFAETDATMKQANANISRIRDELSAASAQREQKEKEHQEIQADVEKGKKRAREVRLSVERENAKNASVSAFKQFVSDNKLKLSDDAMKAGTARAALSPQEIARMQRESQRTAQLGQTLAQNIPAVAPAPSAAPAAAPAAAKTDDHAAH
jgi:hypothetical protein